MIDSPYLTSKRTIDKVPATAAKHQTSNKRLVKTNILIWVEYFANKPKN